MKRLTFFLATCLMVVSSVASAAVQWETNYDHAVAQAKASSKPLVLLFTGSDWCGWCIKLENEALGTPEFASAVGDQFIFVKLDFPMKTSLPKEIATQNSNLKDRFGVKGFPTVIVLDSNENQIGMTGYQPGGGASYAKHLMKMVSSHSIYEKKMNTVEQR